MRKFILTSAKIEGQIEVIFNDDCIEIIDFSKSKMTVQQKDYFLKKFHIALPGLEQFAKDSRLNCTEAEIEITFEMFWDRYNMKVDRKRTLAVWDKLTRAKRIAAYYGVERYERYLQRTDWRNKMESKTFLKNERWEDEW